MEECENCGKLHRNRREQLDCDEKERRADEVREAAAADRYKFVHAERLERERKEVAAKAARERTERYEAWRKANPELAARRDREQMEVWNELMRVTMNFLDEVNAR